MDCSFASPYGSITCIRFIGSKVIPSSQPVSTSSPAAISIARLQTHVNLRSDDAGGRPVFMADGKEIRIGRRATHDAKQAHLFAADFI